MNAFNLHFAKNDINRIGVIFTAVSTNNWVVWEVTACNNLQDGVEGHNVHCQLWIITREDPMAWEGVNLILLHSWLI